MLFNTCELGVSSLVLLTLLTSQKEQGDGIYHI
jgi:hypothetical protein